MAAPLPLILRNPPLRLCTHHLLPPLSYTTTTATTTAKPFSLISFTPYSARSFPILKSTQVSLLPPLSYTTTTATTTAKPFSLISFTPYSARSFPILKSTQVSLLPPLSYTTTTATTTAKPFSLISFTPYNARSFPILKSTQMAGGEITEEVTETTETNVIGKKKVFVAGATGNTGKRIVEQLLAKGFAVKAGVRNLEKAKASLPSDNPALQIVKADVRDGSAKLAEAISDDSDAVICATGFSYGWDVFAPWKVDNFGTVNLVEACRKLGVNRFILVSSILVNGAAMGQILNPAYIFLNVFGLTLIAKLQAENYIRKSGINYTIIRPGGLKNDPPTRNLVMEPEDTLSEGSISRDLVAEVAVEALANPEASYKVVEIVSRPDAPKRSYEDLFGSIKQR